MSRKPKSGRICFKPRARLLKLIGEELISDDVVAVSELVKNAHDADALAVTVAFRGVTGQDGEIIVRDDGCGMDAETFLGRWMEPAASTKVVASSLLTPRGRRVLGEKGVGRFAADKLARHLEIVSRRRGTSEEVRAVINWDLFNDDRLMLDEVLNQWEVRPGKPSFKSGTILRMTGLRSPWNERMFRRLSIRLGRLLSPMRERDKFTIQIESDEFPAYSGELRSDVLKRAPYCLEARFDGRHTISVSTNKSRAVQQRWNGQGELGCGPVRIRLFVFDLDGEAVARVGPRMEVRAWLKEWSGVSIYRDGFRIWPYGEPHDDWLRLDQRRVNNPVEHLSNNQVIGFIDISRDGNPELIDQTNREGLMNNKALEDLRRLVYFVLQVIEAKRQSVRHPVARRPTTINGKIPANGSITEELTQLVNGNSASHGRDLREFVQKLEARIASEQVHCEQIVVGYAGMAAMAQLAGALTQCMPTDLESIRKSVRDLRGVLSASEKSEADLSVRRIEHVLERLSSRLQLLQAAAHQNDRRRAIDVVSEITAFHECVQPLLEMHGVRMDLQFPQKEVVRTEMRPDQLHCLLQILTTNSLDWLKQVKHRRIRISVSAFNDCCEILFSDSGPGIPWSNGSRVFDARFSMKEGGRGMGLTLARRLVEAHGGNIHVILDGRRKGANVCMVLPRKRSRATVYGRRREG